MVRLLRHVLLVASPLWLFSVSELRAGLREPVERVRVLAPSISSVRLEGYASLQNPDTLLLHTHGTVHVVPLDAATKLERFRGRHGRFWTGAGLGFLLGMGVGGYIGAQYAKSDEWFAGLHVISGLVGGAAAGLVAGGIVGAAIRSDRWEKVPLPGGRAESEAHDRVVEGRLSARF